MLSIPFTVSLGLLPQLCLASFGSNWGSGPVYPYKTNPDGTMVEDPFAAENNKIIFGRASIVLPKTPTPLSGGTEGTTLLWLGMGTYNTPYGCIIQGIINHYPTTNDPASACSALGTDRWCVTAFMRCNDRTFPDKSVVAATGQTVTATYTTEGQYPDYYSVEMAVDGKIVSSIAAEVGYANGFGFANECTTKPCGTLEAHDWFDVKLVLQDPDPNYVSTSGPKGSNPEGVTGKISTTDGGKTWTSDRIHVPEFTFTNV